MAMIGRNLPAKLAAVVALALLASCATSGPKQDVEFLRGCWIERQTDGDISMLRLLPSGESDRELAGYLLTYVNGLPPISERYMFSRNGSRMTIGEGKSARTYWRDRKMGKSSDGTGAQHIYYLKAREKHSTEWYVVHSFDDSLMIDTLLIDGEAAPILGYHFRRDGCD
jgi:hypothetical protein